jgi:hypothetical protein
MYWEREFGYKIGKKMGMMQRKEGGEPLRIRKFIDNKKFIRLIYSKSFGI